MSFETHSELGWLIFRKKKKTHAEVCRMKSHGAWLLIQQLLQATSAYLSQLKLFNVLRLHVMTRLVIMIFVITEYVSEVACCASVTPACLLSISNFLSLLCCRTDYLFCYISINVILLLKATECCFVSPQGIFFYFFFPFSWLFRCVKEAAGVASHSQQHLCCRLVCCADALHRSLRAGMTHLCQRCHQHSSTHGPPSLDLQTSEKIKTRDINLRHLHWIYLFIYLFITL